MKLNTMKETIRKALTMNPRRSFFVWGTMGIGKSAAIKQVAEEEGVGFIDLRLLYYDTIDMRGVPVPVNTNGEDKTVWYLPSFLPREGRGILFLDEFNQADPTVQKVGLQLALDYRIGEYNLPEGWIVVAAGNREIDKAMVQKMASPLNNRFIHIDVDLDLDGWVDWAVKNNIHHTIIAFLKSVRPDLLHNFDPKKNPRCFATPRSWEMVSDLINNGFTRKDGLDELIAGTVGAGADVEYLGFVEMFNEIPDYEDIFRNPNTAKVPANPAIKFALTVLLARKADHKNMGAVKIYVERLGAEWAAFTVKHITDLYPKLKSTPEFVTWAIQYSSMFIDTSDDLKKNRVK